MSIRNLLTTTCLALLSMATGLAQTDTPPPDAMGGGNANTISNVAPSMPPETNPPSIDSITIVGSSRFTKVQLESVLTQKVGNKVTLPGVQADLRALAGLYQPAGVKPPEQWQGFGFVTNQVTVTPNIEHPADGHVTITYELKETAH